MRRHWLRFFSRALAPLGLALAWLASPSPRTQAQEAPPAAESPARFVPADGLAMYVEFEGLDAHEDGWRKSAACKILNDTPTGAMLEDLFTQIYGRYNPTGLPAADIVKLGKHIAKSGVVLGASVTGQGREIKGASVMVFRKAFANKEVRPLFARYLQTLPSPGTKTEPKVIGGHKLVTGKHGAETFAWWIEEAKKEDLIIVQGPPGAETIVLDALDGKTPSALTSPLLAELRKPRDGFERAGMAVMDLEAVARTSADAGAARFRASSGLDRLDFALGFQGEALEMVTRIHAARPGDDPQVGAQFDRSALPSLPTNVVGMMAFAANFKALVPVLFSAPTLKPGYEQAVATLKEKTKVRLDEDVLARIGPKVAAYIMPGKASGPGATLPGGLSLIPGLGGGADALAKGAILIDVADPKAFGKTLDELMGFANRSMRGAMAPPRGPGGEGPPPPPPGGPRGRGGPPAPPSPEFRLMGGDVKTYVLNVPPELAGKVPAGLRPTIRLGAKQLAIATSADVARQALDAKGSYAPPAEIADAFGRLPGQLNWLMIVDPRDSTPAILAALPGKLQAAINTLPLPPPPAAAAASTGGSPPAPGGGQQPGVRPGMGGPPAASGQPAAPSPLVLNVDASKLPAAEDIRRLLFPAIHTVDTDGGAIRITSRIAFPPMFDPAAFATGFQLGKAMQAGKLPGAAGPGQPGQPPSGAPGQPPRRGGGVGVQSPD